MRKIFKFGRKLKMLKNQKIRFLTDINFGCLHFFVKSLKYFYKIGEATKDLLSKVKENDLFYSLSLKIQDLEMIKIKKKL